MPRGICGAGHQRGGRGEDSGSHYVDHSIGDPNGPREKYGTFYTNHRYGDGLYDIKIWDPYPVSQSWPTSNLVISFNDPETHGGE